MLEKSLAISLIICFINITTHEGMILEKVNEWFWNVHPWLKKPLFECSVCMCMWWGPTISCCGILWFGWHFNSWQQIMACCMISATFNSIISTYGNHNDNNLTQNNE
jgi:hypothetical protein